MPLLDVNDGFDSSFIDYITVERIIQAIDRNGRVVRLKRRFTNIACVVAAVAPDDLQRLSDYELMNKSITVYFPEFRPLGPARDPSGRSLTETQPDEFIWHDSRFVVHSLQDYSGYGRGFCSVIAISVDAVDAPPLGGSVAGLA